jgi:acetolactate synthase-1/2/3 large subunit
MIDAAERPLLFAGGGVISSGASAELRELAERLDAPVALTLMGLGAFPAGHRLCTGLTGMHGTVASNRAVQKADLLVALGARFSDRVTSRAETFARRAKILQFDIDPAEINKNIPTDFAVTGDLKAILRQLLPALKPGAAHWGGEIARLKEHIPIPRRKRGCASPRDLCLETARQAGEDAIIVTDVGQHQMWTAQFYPFSRPRSFITSGGLGAMGFGLGAAIGAALACPQRPVVLFTGDGSFRMNSGEMATLRAYGIPVLIVIFNNRTLGMVRQWQSLFFDGRLSETDLDRPPDFCLLAAAYGIPAYRASPEQPYAAALALALQDIARGSPALIDVPIDRDEKVLPMVPGGRPVDDQIL